MKKKLLGTLLTLCVVVSGLTGCGSVSTEETKTTTKTVEQTPQSESPAKESDDKKEEPETVEESDCSGTITLAGSTSMEKLCEALTESFMEDYPNVTVTVEYTGSGAGIESLTSGSIEIGNASRHLKAEETEKGAVENVVAIDGIAVITDKDNTVTNLTADQLSGIYKGEIRNWSELGGADEAIVVIGREAGSGTRSAFEELLKVEDACEYAQELDSTGAVLAKVAATPGAIGYVSLDVVDDSVIAMSLDLVEPSEANIIAGSYLLSRPFVMATMGEIEDQNELVQEWFSYVHSKKGQSVISDIGLIIPE